MDKTGTTVGVIGAGTMGSGIAQVTAMAGHKTLLFDSNPVALKKAEDDITKALGRLTEKGKLSAEQAKEISGHISCLGTAWLPCDTGALLSTDPRHSELAGDTVESTE